MKQCPRCGAVISEEEQVCHNCGFLNVIEGEILSETTEEVKTENRQQQQPGEGRPQEGLNTVLKVVLALLIVFVPILGPIAGIVGGIILLVNPDSKMRSYGLQILGLGIVVIILSVVFCCLNGITGIFGVMF